MVRACSVSAAHHVPWLQNLVQRLQGPEAGIKSEKKRFGYEHMTTLLRERVITSLFEEDSPGLGWGGGRGGGYRKHHLSLYLKHGPQEKQHLLFTLFFFFTFVIVVR